MPLFIDLGAFSPFALTAAGLVAAPVAFDGTSTAWRDAMGATYVSRNFVANGLELGGVGFGEVRGIEYFPHAGASLPQAGYIGVGLLRDYLAVFDYPAGMLTLYASGDGAAMSDSCRPQRFEVRVVNGVVQSIVETDRGPLIFQWDTGSSENVLRPSAIGAPASGQHSFARFDLAGHSFGRTIFPLREFQAPNVDGVLGTDFLEDKVLCIDAARRVGAIR